MAINSNSRATPANCLGSRCSAALAATREALRAKICVWVTISLWSWTNLSARPTNSPRVLISWTIRSLPTWRTLISRSRLEIFPWPAVTEDCSVTSERLVTIDCWSVFCADWRTFRVNSSIWLTSSVCLPVFWATVAAISFWVLLLASTRSAATDTCRKVLPNASISRLTVSLTNPVARSFTWAWIVRLPDSISLTTSSNSPISCWSCSFSWQVNWDCACRSLASFCKLIFTISKSCWDVSSASCANWRSRI